MSLAPTSVLLAAENYLLLRHDSPTKPHRLELAVPRARLTHASAHPCAPTGTREANHRNWAGIALPLARARACAREDSVFCGTFPHFFERFLRKLGGSFFLIGHLIQVSLTLVVMQLTMVVGAEDSTLLNFLLDTLLGIGVADHVGDDVVLL